MLRDDRPVVGHSRIGPQPRGIDHLKEWHRTFAVRTQRDPSRFFRPSEETGRISARELRSAFGENLRGGAGAAKIRRGGPLLRGQLERRNIALGACALNLASILIE